MNNDTAISRWAARVHEQGAKAHHDQLRAAVGLIATEQREPRNLGDVLQDVEERRALIKAQTDADARSALYADARFAVTRGWWSTFKVLAAQAVDVRGL